MSDIITFYLVRHGESENNVLNIMNSLPEEKKYHLTERGRAQVEKTAALLVPKHIDVIIASPLLRTRETAEIISEKAGIPIIFDKRLCELGDGIFNNRPIQEFLEKYPDAHMRVSLDPTDGVESLIDMRGRLESFLRDAEKQYANKKVAVVSHADPIEQLYGILTNESPGQAASGPLPKNASHMEIEWKVDSKKRLLFICSANMMRSPTAEDLFKDSEKYETKSAGILDMAVVKATQAHIDWADTIFIFSEKENGHLTCLRRHFDIAGKEVIDLGIPNIYDRGDPELVRLLKGKLAKFLDE